MATYKCIPTVKEKCDFQNGFDCNGITPERIVTLQAENERLRAARKAKAERWHDKLLDDIVKLAFDIYEQGVKDGKDGDLAFEDGFQADVRAEIEEIFKNNGIAENEVEPEPRALMLWISVEERLPKRKDAYKDGWLVVLRDDDKTDFCRWNEVEKGCITSGRKYTHWLPMPPDPTKEQTIKSVKIQTFQSKL